MEPKCVRVVVIGAGSRGSGYARYAEDHPERMKVVAVAEPREIARNSIKKLHGLSDDVCLETWEKALTPGFIKYAGIDAAIIATQDRMHTEPAVTAIGLNLAVLLEKPMAVTREECEYITEVAMKKGGVFAVCHVLRYMPLYVTAAKALQNGIIGRIKMIDHTEPVGHWHWSHSFVRGSWTNEEDSTFSLMAKTCHDIDLIRSLAGSEAASCYLMAAPVEYVDSRNQPKEAHGATRCLECPIQDTCPASAKRTYIDRLKSGRRGWPVKIVDPMVKEIEDLGEAVEHLTEVLKTSKYGRCAWHCEEHNVRDTQVASIVFENGAMGIMKMVGHSDRLCDRFTHIYGMEGEMKIDMEANTIEVFRFVKPDGTRGEWRGLPIEKDDVDIGQLDGHGGADFHCISSFIEAVAMNDPSMVMTDATESLKSHQLVFDLQDTLDSTKYESKGHSVKRSRKDK